MTVTPNPLDVDAGLDGLLDRAAAQTLVQHWRADRAAVEADQELAGRAKADRLAAINETAQRQVAALRAQRDEKLNTARENARNAAQAPPDDPAAYGRAYDRVQQMLAAGQRPHQIANAATDRLTLRALREALPAYQQLNRMRSHDIAATEELITRAEVPLLSKEEASAREILARADDVEAFSNTNLAQLEREAKGGMPADLFVTGRDQVLSLETGDPIGPNGRPVAQAPRPATFAEFMALPDEQRRKVPAEWVRKLTTGAR